MGFRRKISRSLNCCPLKATCFQPSNTRSFIPAEGELNARMQRIVKEIQRVRPDRLVIEALSELRMLTKGPLRYGRQILSLKNFMADPSLFSPGGGATTAYTEMMVRLRTPMGNIDLIERPLRPARLISSVRAAIRSRLRQYEIRDHLEEREQVEEGLRRAHDELESPVEKRTLALRRLSARLMRVQDEERPSRTA